LSLPPEGEQPGGNEPFEGVPPEDLEKPEKTHGDLPDLEPEFIEALSQAAGESTEPGAADAPPHEEPEPVPEEPETPQGSEDPPAPESTKEPAPEPPAESTEEEAPQQAPAEAGPPEGDSAPAETVEFTPQEVAKAQQPLKVSPAVSAPQPGAAPPTPGAPPPPATPAQPAAPTQPGTAAKPSAPPAAAGPPSVPAAPRVPQKPPPDGDFEAPPGHRRLWLRFLVASVVVIGSMASATSASVLLYFDDIAGQLGDLPGVKRQLLPPETGEPENILILGSDKRASLPGTKGLSDTTILLRLDPDNNAIALMSIPRDLKTYIPGVGVNKFNAAYAYGGPKLTLRVVKRITGLPINHVVNVDFLGFVRAVNAIGCVYVDVDRRYYHSNVGLPASQQYSEIDIQPGYEKLCGKDALEYVRYRHTDTDLVRAARQQDFLREARQQVPASDLFFDKRKQLINIFTAYTTSDIDSGGTMLQVLELFVASRNAPIKEIHFPGILHPSFVTATKSSIKEAVDRFLGIEASGGPRGALDLPTNSGDTGIVPEQRKRDQAAKEGKKKEKAPPTPSLGNDGLVDASQGGRDVAAPAAAKTLRSFPVFYPRRLPAGSIYVQQPLLYHLHDKDGQRLGAYKMVLQLPQGDYFGVQGLHGWSDPPILSNPSETRTMSGRDYDIFLDGDRVRLVSWHQGDNSYWVSNSLLQTLTNNQMLGIARTIGKLPGQRLRQHKKGKG
jgi:LCP family protein required for cell wall assembly